MQLVRGRYDFFISTGHPMMVEVSVRTFTFQLLYCFVIVIIESTMAEKPLQILVVGAGGWRMSVLVATS